MVATVGDEFIDKLIALVVKLCNFADSVIFHGISHAIGHAICIGAGFLISFVFEWVFLWLKKRDRAFDKDNKENNKKVYNELWWRSFWSNLGAFIPAALIGIGLAILSVLTCGIGCVVMIAVCIALGCLIKYLIKRSWDKEKRKYYRAICIFDFKGCHSTFDIDKLQEKYERLKSDANDKYFDANDKRKFLEDLDEAYPIMIEYCRIKNEDGGLIAAKMQAYIVEKEKSECLIM